METGTVTPSVRVALAIARVFRRSVEEIFGVEGSNQEAVQWAWAPRAEEASYWTAREANGWKVYPVESLDINPVAPDGHYRSGVFHPVLEDPPHTLTLATCDPSINFLAAELSRRCGARLLVFPRNAGEGLVLLGRGAVHAATLHASCRESPDANLHRVRETLGTGWILLRMVDWTSGVALPSSDRTRSIISLARANRRWALREPGAVARESLDALLGSRQPQGCTVRGHREVASAIRSGWADAGVCLEFCATEAGLNFLPHRKESLDLVFHENLLPDFRIQKLIDLLGSKSWRDILATLPGYNSQQTGEVQTT